MRALTSLLMTGGGMIVGLSIPTEPWVRFWELPFMILGIAMVIVGWRRATR